MKRFFSVLAFLLIVCLSATCLVACVGPGNNNDDIDNSTAGTETTRSVDEIMRAIGDSCYLEISTTGLENGSEVVETGILATSETCSYVGTKEGAVLSIKEGDNWVMYDERDGEFVRRENETDTDGVKLQVDGMISMLLALKSDEIPYTSKKAIKHHGRSATEYTNVINEGVLTELAGSKEVVVIDSATGMLLKYSLEVREDTQRNYMCYEVKNLMVAGDAGIREFLNSQIAKIATNG